MKFFFSDDSLPHLLLLIDTFSSIHRLKLIDFFFHFTFVKFSLQHGVFFNRIIEFIYKIIKLLHKTKSHITEFESMS